MKLQNIKTPKQFKFAVSKPFVIIGNCKSILEYNYKDIIDNDFASIRFPIDFESVYCVRNALKNNPRHYLKGKYKLYLKKWKEIDLDKNIGKENIIFNTKAEARKYNYNINGVYIHVGEIYKYLTNKYQSKPTRGFLCIHIILAYYKKCNKKMPLIIHGFSFTTSTYFSNMKYKCNTCCWTPCICYVDDGSTEKKLKLKRNIKAHNYKIEKKVVKKLIKEGKVIFLNDYINNNKD